MKTEPKLPAQTKPKSIQEMTVFELSEIDKFQNRNRGFYDDDDEDDLESLHGDSDFDWED